MTLDADPNRAAVHCNLGNLWQQLDDQDRAIECYNRALTCDSTLVPAMQNLGYLLFNHGRTEEAELLYQRLVAHDPSPMNRLLASGVLPVVYESREHVQICRRVMLERLDAMIADGVTVDTTKTLIPTSFFLAYQGLNDVEVAQRLAKILIGPTVVSSARGPLRTRSDGRLRIGFVSAYFRDHTIGRLNLGRIERLDREKFEVTVLMASPRQDSVTATFRSTADRYRVLPRDVQAARNTIADQDLDVLIFADVGMDALTTTLAWSRMAPVQCVTWGHPDTTGSPHIDYFLSSALLEADDADDHYTEQLVRLPLLATYFERPERHTAGSTTGVVDVATSPSGLDSLPRPLPNPSLVDAATPAPRSLNGGSKPRDNRRAIAAGFGLNKDTNHYVCPQTLFKFHPDFDAILAGILRADPTAEIVLLEGRVPQWTARLKARFQRTLPDGCERVTFLPAMPRVEFLKLLACADVVIDTPHFGGGHTSYETFSVGTPLVTLPGDFLRSRITQALYQRMGIDDLIANSAEEFIELAVRLGTSEEARRDASKRIHDASSILMRTGTGLVVWKTGCGR
ncbi:MAG: tetratricopeptide repeat protein [Pirellulaceae bacterium]